MRDQTKSNARTWAVRGIIAALVLFTAFVFNGCAVGGGYAGGYYVPSYSGYYSDYGYNGYPYWGDGPYVGSAVVIGGRSHRGYYGGHHFAHDWHGGGRTSVRGGFSGRTSAPSAGAHGGGRR